MLEKDVEDYLVEMVEAVGGSCEKVTSLSGRGFFDRLVLLPGGIVAFVEVKRPKGAVISMHQKARAERYIRLGATVAVVKNHSEVRTLVRTLTEMRPA
jgi:hypothetical protein